MAIAIRDLTYEELTKDYIIERVKKNLKGSQKKPLSLRSRFRNIVKRKNDTGKAVTTQSDLPKLLQDSNDFTQMLYKKLSPENQHFFNTQICDALSQEGLPQDSPLDESWKKVVSQALLDMNYYFETEGLKMLDPEAHIREALKEHLEKRKDNFTTYNKTNSSLQSSIDGSENFVENPAQPQSALDEGNGFTQTGGVVDKKKEPAFIPGAGHRDLSKIQRIVKRIVNWFKVNKTSTEKPANPVLVPTDEGNAFTRTESNPSTSAGSPLVSPVAKGKELLVETGSPRGIPLPLPNLPQNNPLIVSASPAAKQVQQLGGVEGSPSTEAPYLQAALSASLPGSAASSSESLAYPPKTASVIEAVSPQLEKGKGNNSTYESGGGNAFTNTDGVGEERQKPSAFDHPWARPPMGIVERFKRKAKNWLNKASTKTDGVGDGISKSSHSFIKALEIAPNSPLYKVLEKHKTPLFFREGSPAFRINRECTPEDQQFFATQIWEKITDEYNNLLKRDQKFDASNYPLSNFQNLADHVLDSALQDLKRRDDMANILKKAMENAKVYLEENPMKVEASGKSPFAKAKAWGIGLLSKPKKEQCLPEDKQPLLQDSSHLDPPQTTGGDTKTPTTTAEILHLDPPQTTGGDTGILCAPKRLFHLDPPQTTGGDTFKIQGLSFRWHLDPPQTTGGDTNEPSHTVEYGHLDPPQTTGGDTQEPINTFADEHLDPPQTNGGVPPWEGFYDE